jgi:hypothetical protein
LASISSRSSSSLLEELESRLNNKLHNNKLGTRMKEGIPREKNELEALNPNKIFLWLKRVSLEWHLQK